MNIYNTLNLYTNEMHKFLVKYKNIIIISMLTGIFVNAVDIFTIKFGVDSEWYSLEKAQVYYRQSRFGSLILYYIFPFARYHMLSQITGVIALTLAALLTVSRHNIPYSAKLLFVLLFVTYPSFLFIQYFYFQSAYNFIGLLFVVIAYRMIENNKNIFFYILSIFLLFIGVSSYQSNVPVFLTVMVINVTLDYIKNNNLKACLIKIIKSVIILLITIAIYYIVVKLLHGNFGSNYSKFIGYSSGFLYGLEQVAILIKDTLLSKGGGGEIIQQILLLQCC